MGSSERAAALAMRWQIKAGGDIKRTLRRENLKI